MDPSRELIERCANLQRRLDALEALARDSAVACHYWDEESDWGPDCQERCDCGWGTLWYSTVLAIITGEGLE